MAYSISWDEGVPVGATTAAADIDTEIQKVKTSLRERLTDVMPDFDDDLLDPKLLTMQTDVHANRPATPDYPGQMWFSYDTAVLYVGDATPAWVATGGLPEEGDDETPSASFSVSATLTALFSCPTDNVWRPLSGWTIIMQRGSIYSAGAPTRFTSPASGDYKITGGFHLAPSGSLVEVRSAINGGNPGSASPRAYAGGSSVEFTSALTQIWQDVAEGSYIEFWVRSPGPGANPVVGALSAITMHRLP